MTAISAKLMIQSRLIYSGVEQPVHRRSVECLISKVNYPEIHQYMTAFSGSTRFTVVDREPRQTRVFLARRSESLFHDIRQSTV